MITHDCLNVINENFTVILISLLYFANFFGIKSANNFFLSLICMKNERTSENPSMDPYVIKAKLHDDV